MTQSLVIKDLLPHLPILVALLFLLSRLPRLILKVYRSSLNRRNQINRTRLLTQLGIVIPNEKLIVGFFHPYCNAGGGGERVLWTAVALHQRTHAQVVCAIYTGDIGVTKTEMVEKVKTRFGIQLNPDTLLLIPLKLRYLVESSTWSRFTLLGQSTGSIALGYEALCALIPDIYIDTMGYAFTFPVFRLLSKAPIGAYVHYPTISTDMLQRVSQRSTAHNNSSTISNSFILSYGKLLYYKIFAQIYSICLNQADHLMVNSTWTKNHIDGLLKGRSFKDDPSNSTLPQSTETTSSIEDRNEDRVLNSERSRQTLGDGLRSRKSTKGSIEEVDKKGFRSRTTRVVYPPCDVESFKEFPLKPRLPQIISISQFRPEKDQATQIEAFAKFLTNLKPDHPNKSLIKLILVGSCRDQLDEERVIALKELTKKLDVMDHVEFHVNVSWNHLKSLLSQSLVGLSTMVDEHFGISIVEFMASGLIPLAHKSGGPLLDIIVPIQSTTTTTTSQHHQQPQQEQQEQEQQLVVNEEEEEEKMKMITGFHANGIEDYSIKLKRIFLDLNQDEILKIQANARFLAINKFSIHQFQIHWLQSFNFLLDKV